MAPTVFADKDWDNLELARRIVLQRLKAHESWHQFDHVWDEHSQSVVTFDPPRLRDRFVVLANEVMWRLVIEGLITPGLDASNPTLPWFRLTDYGRKVLESEHLGPHDPTGYLDELRAEAKTVVDEVALGYLEEALRCYTTGCNVAAVLLLGVAAESAFLRLCDTISGSLKNASEKQAFNNLPDLVKPRHRWIVSKYQSLPASERKALPESLDMTLASLYELIRRQRNELGHPRDTLPTLDREKTFLFFRLFPGFAHDVEVFAAYCKQKGL